MFVKYIDLNGNWQEFDERTQPGWRNNYLQSESGVWYEKKPAIKQEKKVEVVEDYSKYKAYLKSIKFKWFGLLKWENLKLKALENGYVD